MLIFAALICAFTLMFHIINKAKLMRSFFTESTTVAARICAANLKRIIEQKHIERKCLALTAGIDYCQLTDYLNARHMPSYKTLAKLSKTLGVAIEALISDEGQHTNPVATVGVDYKTTNNVPIMARTRKSDSPQPQVAAQHLAAAQQPAAASQAVPMTSSPAEPVASRQVEAQPQQPRLKDLTKAFSRRILRVHLYLTEQAEHRESYMSRQMMESGTKIASILLRSNYTSGKEAFYQSASQALDMARDTEYWLDLLHEAGYLTDAQFSSVTDDLHHITSILWSISNKRRQKEESNPSASTTSSDTTTLPSAS